MITRFKPPVFMALFAAIPSVVMAMIAAVAPPVSISHAIYDDLWLSAFSLVASTVGAYLGVYLFPPDISPDEDDIRRNMRRMSLKFGACLCCGLLFGPIEVRLVAERFNLPITRDLIMAVVGGTAVGGVFVLHKLAPRAEKIEELIIAWWKG